MAEFRNMSDFLPGADAAMPAIETREDWYDVKTTRGMRSVHVECPDGTGWAVVVSTGNGGIQVHPASATQAVMDRMNAEYVAPTVYWVDSRPTV